MIKAIVFDFGDVLSVQSVSLKTLYEFVDQLKMSPEESMNKVLGSEHIMNLMRDRISLNQFNEVVASLQGITKELQEKIGDRIHENTQLEPEVMKIVKELKPKYKMAILSDHIKGVFEGHIDRFKLVEYFDDIVFSAEHGFLKEDGKLFDILLEKINLKAEECVFVDDREINIKVAKEKGFVAIHFKNAEQLREDLEKLGVINKNT